jgi:ADP-ribose pyrophosphatase
VRRDLSEHQRAALKRYYALMESHPDYFADRPLRPIVRDPEVLEGFAEEHRIVLGVAVATPYVWLLNDLVQTRADSGEVQHSPYLRLLTPFEADRKGHTGSGREAGGAVVLATVPGTGGAAESIVLVEQERHATGSLELELPRGVTAPGASAKVQALRELREETGYIGERAEWLGTTLTDSGLTDASVAFFHVPTQGRVAATPEPAEAISRVVLSTREELWERIDAGTVRDAFTVQALGLYERRLRHRGGPA